MARSATELERALVRQVNVEGPLSEAVRELLERLVDDLLGTLGGRGTRPTDGLILRRGGGDGNSFWVLGRVYMLEGPPEQPVWMEFVLTEVGDGIASGRVLCGIRDDNLKPGFRRGKLENQLLAYAHEVVEEIPWQQTFMRDGSGWTKAERTGVRQE